MLHTCETGHYVHVVVVLFAELAFFFFKTNNQRLVNFLKCCLSFGNQTLSCPILSVLILLTL